jgi:MerR family transcriptional regulator, thiopeptide resistance regulator
MPARSTGDATTGRDDPDTCPPGKLPPMTHDPTHEGANSDAAAAGPPPWTVHGLATLTGVSVRTLHHYDHVGLLPPARVDANGYRRYGRAELARLQQVLFFRELGFPLARIRQLLDDPGLDAAAAYRDHRRLLVARRERLDGLIAALDRELGHAAPDPGRTTGGTTMTTDESHADPFGRYDDDALDALREEARQRWGETDGWRDHEARAATLTPGRTAEGQRRMNAALRRVVAHMGEGTAGPTVRDAVADYREAMATWYRPTDEVLGQIARMYVDDARYAETFRRYHPDLPVFLRDAILHTLGAPAT